MSDWTKEEPSIGTWWLSIAPEKRPAAHGAPFPAVIKCHVDIFHTPRPTKHCNYDGTTYWHPIDDDRFKGAQWKRVDPDPADPFADQPKLSPEAERIWKSLSPATEVSGGDARRLLESLVDVASPEEVARRRAVSRERLRKNDELVAKLAKPHSRDNDLS